MHRGLLNDISRTHSHLVEDDRRLGQAVARAYAEVFGSVGDGEALRATVMAQHTGTPRMPPAEGALLALRQLSPVLADQVLDRARHHYGVAGAARLPGADDAAASSH